jgi:hypothetical protein
MAEVERVGPALRRCVMDETVVIRLDEAFPEEFGDFAEQPLNPWVPIPDGVPMARPLLWETLWAELKERMREAAVGEVCCGGV